MAKEVVLHRSSPFLNTPTKYVALCIDPTDTIDGQPLCPMLVRCPHTQTQGRSSLECSQTSLETFNDSVCVCVSHRCLSVNPVRQRVADFSGSLFRTRCAVLAAIQSAAR